MRTIGRATAAALLGTAAATAMTGCDAQADAASAAADQVAPKCEAEPARSSGLKAFPTAEGFGQYAVGGRGGRVYAVTTLTDSGPGSLRACAEAEGPRTCVFRVSGTIAVDTWISVQHPYLTIAGQTSPGGIAIRLGESTNTPLLVQTHDVVVRYLRLRPGPSRIKSDNVDTLQISGGAHDVIVDHLSTSWPTDEGINIVGDGHRVRPCMDTRNVTIQWSILSEGLNRANRGPHSRGTYFGYGARDITFHHNLIADNYRRNPLVNTRGQFDMINNVFYNSQRYNGELYTRFGDLFVNAVGNVAVRGPAAQPGLQLYMFNYFRDFPARFGIYLKDNLDWRRQDGGDERRALDPTGWSYVKPAPIGRLSLPPAAIDGSAHAYRRVLADAGATRPRDATDVRLLRDIGQCHGAIIDDPAQVGGWPVLAGPAPPADSDGDGIPDAWETAHGLSPDNPSDGNGIAGSGGYTNLEVYLNELAGDGRHNPDDGAGPDLTCGMPTPPPAPSPVVRIIASPAVVTAGQATTLSWSGEHINMCKGFGTMLPPTGERTMRPEKTETYEIHCVGEVDTDAIDSAVVTVRAAAPASP